MKENKKLFSFKGIIGRRNFFLNIVLIWAIYLIFIIPYTNWFVRKINTLADYFAVNVFFAKAPIFLKIWFVLGTLLVSALIVSNIFRRLNDIFGKNILFLNIIISSIIVLCLFWIFIPSQAAMIISSAAFLLSLILLFKEGAITSQMPYDFRKEFNWGAFFGTWLWGLYNKSFVPLLYLLVFVLPCEPWRFAFLLYCGLKGNEWAYKNKKWDDVSEFNKSQENQAVFWIIIMPIICLLLTITACYSLVKYSDKPNNLVKIEKYIEKYINSSEKFMLSQYTSYSVSASENKFYVDPKKWNSYSYNTKMQLLRNAAAISAKIKTENYNKKHPKDSKYFSQYDELPRTRIYSSTNFQLLGGYISFTSRKDEDFVKLIKNISMSFRFYNAD